MGRTRATWNLGIEKEKNKDCNYFHPDDEFVENVKTRYEFEWVKNGTPKFKLRPNLSEANKTKIIDFLEITTSKIYTLKEKIEALIKTYFDPVFQPTMQKNSKLTWSYKNFYNIIFVHHIKIRHLDPKSL